MKLSNCENQLVFYSQALRGSSLCSCTNVSHSSACICSSAVLLAVLTMLPLEDGKFTFVKRWDLDLSKLMVCSYLADNLGEQAFFLPLLLSELPHQPQRHTLFHAQSVLSSLPDANNSPHTLSIPWVARGRASPNNGRQLYKGLYFPCLYYKQMHWLFIWASFIHKN